MNHLLTGDHHLSIGHHHLHDLFKKLSYLVLPCFGIAVECMETASTSLDQFIQLLIMLHFYLYAGVTQLFSCPNGCRRASDIEPIPSWSVNHLYLLSSHQGLTCGTHSCLNSYLIKSFLFQDGIPNSTFTSLRHSNKDQI
ncbi:hypothetical protein DNTS_015724 [Danionella cerebrum]|uniref:Uncharacterized protein n=1 Tax=Danionella cerebrum TaxID=2873325 RepID=A0A553QD11_9TELE|nr:hypothetical protein DNTS_015724 [Danionella translucida]